ncbi:hypothetical protein D3C84_393880 [compost metagenome]
MDRLARAQALLAFQQQGEVDHHDGVLHHDADQQQQADQGDEAQFGTAGPECQQRADRRRGQGGEDGQRMQGALVEHAQHDVDAQQGGQDQPGLVVQRRLEYLGAARQAAAHRRRRGQCGEGRIHRPGRFAEGHAGRQVERQGAGGGLVLVVDRQRSHGRLEAGEGRQRHHAAVVAGDPDVAQGLGVPGEVRGQAEHHMVLVERLVEDRYQALAEGVAQGRVQLPGADAEPGGGRPVDVQAGLQAAFLPVAGNVGELRQPAQGVVEARRPVAQVVEVAGVEGVLVQRRALAAADVDVLLRRQQQGGARHAGQLRPQPGDDLRGAGLALVARLEAGEHHVAAALAGVLVEGVDIRVLADDRHQLFDLVAQGAEGQALVGLEGALQAPGVLLREEAPGQAAEQVEVQAHSGQQQGEHGAAMLQGPAQGAAVAPGQPLQQGFDWRGPGLGVRTQKVGAEHRGGGQRDDQRNRHRHRQGHHELLQQAADYAAHEQHRDEYREQGQGHGQHRETDLADAAQGCRQWPHALLQMACGVLHHDYGVVDHEAGGDDQRHQRQVVEAVAEQVDHHQAAEQRRRDRQQRDRRGAAAAQEQVDHQDHQGDGDRQGVPDLGQGGAHRARAIHVDLDLDVGGDRVAQLRQQRDYGVHGGHHVGVRLVEHRQHHRGLAIGGAGIAQVLQGVADLRHIAQAHRRAVAPGDDQSLEVGRLVRAVVDLDQPLPVGAFQEALGPVDVGAGQGGADLAEPDAIVAQRGGIDLDPHRRKAAAVDVDLADAGHLGDLLAEQGEGDVVQLLAAAGGRGQADGDNGCAGQVHLAIGRYAGHVGRQHRLRRVDRRLHFAGGGFHVLAQFELQADTGRALAAAGGHLGDPGDAPQAALQGCRHGGRHHFRAGAGQAGLHADGRHVHLRQGGDGHAQERDGAGQDQRQGQQAGGHRPLQQELQRPHPGSPASCAGRAARPSRRPRRSNAR